MPPSCWLEINFLLRETQFYLVMLESQIARLILKRLCRTCGILLIIVITLWRRHVCAVGCVHHPRISHKHILEQIGFASTSVNLVKDIIPGFPRRE